MSVNRLFSHLRIRAKLILAFLTIGLIPVLVLGSFSLTSSKKALQNSAIMQVHSALTAKVERIQDALRHAEKDLRLLSQSPSLITFAEFYPGNVVGRNNLNRMLIRSLEDLAEENPLYSQILLLNPKGEQVLRVFRRDGKLMIQGPDPSLNFSKEDFFWKALDTSRGEIIITSSPLGSMEGKDDLQTLIYSTAIYDRGHTQKGILTLRFLVKDIARLASSGEDALGNTYLMDHHGGFLYNIDNNTQYPILGGFPGTLDEPAIQKILSGHEGLIAEEKNRILSYAPIFPGISESDNFWVMVIDLSRSVVYAPVRRFLLFLGIMVIALAVIGTLLGITASHHLIRPILMLHKGAQLIAKGDFDHKITVQTNDEIEDLAVQFNLMAQRLKESRRRLIQWNEDLQQEVEKRTQQLFQADKMAALGGLSAGIAHEIGNPLASMKTNIQLLNEKLGEQNVHSIFLKRILNEIDRLSKFFKTFSSFARPVKPQLAPCDIRQIIREVILFVKKEAETHGVELREAYEHHLPLVQVDFQRMQQVFLNLFLNAIQAMPQGGAITISVHAQKEDVVDATSSEKVMITVSDTGQGIPESLRPKIFEPFFTTKPNGMGLGLSITHQIVMENHGAISMESFPEKGTTFSILLQAVRLPVAANIT
ncbi:MAG: ATP-binding protein [bacterium]